MMIHNYSNKETAAHNHSYISHKTTHPIIINKIIPAERHGPADTHIQTVISAEASGQT